MGFKNEPTAMHEVKTEVPIVGIFHASQNLYVEGASVGLAQVIILA